MAPRGLVFSVRRPCCSGNVVRRKSKRSRMEDELSAAGPRLRAIRESRRMTIRSVSDATGISVSTISRLESGNRRAQLELLMPLARLYRLPLDDLVGAPALGDPRIHPRRRSGTASSRCRCPAAPRRGRPSNRCIRQRLGSRSGNGSTRAGTGPT
ncbi:helix-turn-helix domain-containing protein [Actinomadura coerulea]|uniref:helix-turn-helix domain-containing protein n=1 Tax=Actinomadura coerulea TaxID=46159 RepID=UPI00343CE4D0